MKIILNQDVVNLGEEGDVKEVKPGYARNFLIPKGYGVAYSKTNIALFEGRKKAIEKRKDEKRQRAVGIRGTIEQMHLTIHVTTGETGRLFGSVNSAVIMEELARNGVEVERRRIEVPDHAIKQTGTYTVRIKLYGNEVASLKVTVVDPNEKKTVPAEAARAGTAETQAAGGDAATDESVEAPIDTDAHDAESEES